MWRQGNWYLTTRTCHANRILDRLMPEIGLDGPGIDAIVRQLLRKLAAGLSRFEPERSRRWRRQRRRRRRLGNDLQQRHGAALFNGYKAPQPPPVGRLRTNVARNRPVTNDTRPVGALG
jgi:hypothetical protein